MPGSRVTLPCPRCRTLLDVERCHNLRVDCACGAEWVVRADVAGYRLRERIVDSNTLRIAFSHLKNGEPNVSSG